MESKMGKKRILFLATLPPPIHGSAVVSQQIKDSKLIQEVYDCDFVNLSTSRKIDEIGKSRPAKIWRFISSFSIEFWKLFTRHYDLCYISLTCHGIGFLKDAPFALLCKLFGRKLIIHQHNKGMANDVGKWPYKWLLPLVYNDTRVILLSWYLYPDIEKVVPKENVVVCPNGIYVDSLSLNLPKRSNKVPRLLFLSNLIESKGVLVLLDALVILKKKGYSFICDFVGGETKEIDAIRFNKEVEKRGLKQFAIYQGKKFDEEKNRVFNESDIFVFPTYYDNECFPLVLLEAMQHGLPCVTTDEGGIRDIIIDGVNGFIVKHNSSMELADKIAILLSNEVCRTQMGINGLEKLKREYTLEVFENRIVDVLNNLIIEKEC